MLCGQGKNPRPPTPEMDLLPKKHHNVLYQTKHTYLVPEVFPENCGGSGISPAVPWYGSFPAAYADR